MDYAQLAKRLRESAEYLSGMVETDRELAPFVTGNRNSITLGITAAIEEAQLAQEAAADAIEALTSPPDEAQVDAAMVELDFGDGPPLEISKNRKTLRAALNAAHRVRVKNEAKA